MSTSAWFWPVTSYICNRGTNLVEAEIVVKGKWPTCGVRGLEKAGCWGGTKALLEAIFEPNV